jgi:hypothetical protein
MVGISHRTLFIVGINRRTQVIVGISRRTQVIVDISRICLLPEALDHPMLPSQHRVTPAPRKFTLHPHRRLKFLLLL